MEAARLLMEVMRDQAPLSGRLARRGAPRPRRAHAALDAHPHVRRRHQRDAARPDRDLRARHARQPPLTIRPETNEHDGLRTHRRARGAAGPRPAASSKTAWTLAHLKARDCSDDWYDRDTWREFAKANLLGIAFPESAGGLGLGFLDLCFVLREVGRNVAPLPAIPTLVAGALPIARFGTDAQQAILAEGRAPATCCSPRRSSSSAPSPSSRRRPRRATATAGASTA